MAVSPPKPYCRTHKRQCMAVSPPKSYCRTHKRQCMAVSPPKPYCHTNNEINVWQSVHPSLPVVHMRDNVWQWNHPSLTVIQMRDKCMAVSPPKPYSHTFVSYFLIIIFFNACQFTQFLLSVFNFGGMTNCSMVWQDSFMWSMKWNLSSSSHSCLSSMHFVYMWYVLQFDIFVFRGASVTPPSSPSDFLLLVFSLYPFAIYRECSIDPMQKGVSLFFIIHKHE